MSRMGGFLRLCLELKTNRLWFVLATYIEASHNQGKHAIPSTVHSDG